jgi:hypothetical protein
MRRARIPLALCLLIISAAAWASTLASARTPTRRPAEVLIGNPAVGRGVRSTRPGLAEAFRFRSRSAGTITATRVYIDGHNAARMIVAALYSNRGARPGRRLAIGSLSRPRRDAWNTITIGSAAIAARGTYWIAVLGRGGKLYMRETQRWCSSASSILIGVKSLPPRWGSRPHRKSCAISAYGRASRPGTGAPTSGGTQGSGGGSGAGAGGGNGGGSGGPISGPCPLTAAAQSCWASHTGVPGYTEAQILAGQSPLTHVVGDVTVTTNGAVIRNEWIDGCIAIDANDVTIEDSLIHTQDGCQGGNGGSAPSAINDGLSGTTGLLIEDTEVDGMNGAGNTFGVTGDNYTCLRCNVHGFTQNFQEIANALIQDSYSHYLNINDQCAHANVVYDESAANSIVEHSYLDASGTGSGCITAAFNFEGAWGSPTNLTVDDSYLAGHAGADIAGDCGATNIHITNDALSANNGYNGTDYVYAFDSSNSGNVWKGNRVPELGGEAAPPPTGNPGNGNC